MDDSAFDPSRIFNDDYMWFYGPLFSGERNRADTNEIITTLGFDHPSSILDAPCGHGRIANLLAEKGHEVTGVDITRPFLDQARAGAAELGVAVDYRHGDLRQLPVDGPFDAVICWFTSFGYFNDRDNKAVLAEFSRVLRPGGALIIEMLNRDGFVRGCRPAPAATVLERGDDVMTDVSSFDPISGRVETDRTVYRQGKTHRSHLSVRLPTVPELDVWLADAGFCERSFTDRSGRPLKYDSWRLVVVAHT